MLLDKQRESSALLKNVRSIPIIQPTPLEPNMATYPTPPSSSGDSPQPIYFVASPGSNSFSVASPEAHHPYIQAQIVPSEQLMNISGFAMENAPYLSFVEEPTNKFRFRYKSEMAGTHGSLCGMNSDKSRKQTYPTVELKNCSENAIIRCSIYQYNLYEDFKPHPHRLIMKRGREEFDDPHDIPVGPEEGFVATFHSMGIIHTARKHIVGELVRKKSQLKKELIARMEGKQRELTNKELMEIKGLAEQESKSINLNIVCLRFDAFIVKDGILIPLCAPLYSSGINNLKCALTGDLKIVRLDHCTSPAKGGKEVFLLVERVTKKNIKIRFFQLDDEEQEVWEGWGKFSELDVHHQYAIVFRTPAYEDQNITAPVKVYMELVRPSDNARSEWKEFRYVPNNEFKAGAKRPRSSLYSSSSSYNSGSLSSNELPVTINAVTAVNHGPTHLGNIFTALNHEPVTMNSWPTEEILTQDQMDIALKDIDSNEFRKLYEIFEPEYIELTSNAKDSPQVEISKHLKNIHIGPNYEGEKRPVSKVVKLEVSDEDLRFAERTYQELKSFIKSKDAHKRITQMLNHYLGEAYKTNALHVFVGLNKKEEVTFFLKMIVLTKSHELVNIPNADSLTPLHIAVMCSNEEFVMYLLRLADPYVADKSGRTALHMAVEGMAGPSMLELLLVPCFAKKLVDLENNDGESPLAVAMERRNMTAIKMLTYAGADVNKKKHKNGFTPLRIAIENQYVGGIKYLLDDPNFRMSEQNDFNNVSPYEAARIKNFGKGILDLIAKRMVENGLPLIKIEPEDEDDESDEEMEEDIECKPEILMESNPGVDIETLYANVTKLTEKCLQKVAFILDESGKYQPLAELLDLSHLINSGVFPADSSPSKNLLLYATEKDNVKVMDIRNFLEVLDEYPAVKAMDQMAMEINGILK